MSLTDKIKSIITSHQLTPSHFADQIGVQRSSISHILSGRNRPSLDIVQRIVTQFPDVTYDWLLESEENNSSSERTPTRRIASLDEHTTAYGKSELVSESKKSYGTDIAPGSNLPKLSIDTQHHTTKVKSIEKILIFYSDNTFIEYLPSTM